MSVVTISGYGNKTIFANMISGMKSLADVLESKQYQIVNTVARKTMTDTRREIRAEVNLTDRYIRDRMDLVPASSGRAVAYVIARARATRLATYGARQLTRAAKRAKGDPLRGIGSGRKQAGISVAVDGMGARKPMPGAFLIPLRAGKEPSSNGMGVFIRVGPGKKDIKHEYGPSVNQLFRWNLRVSEQKISAALDAETQRVLEYELKRIYR